MAIGGARQCVDTFLIRVHEVGWAAEWSGSQHALPAMARATFESRPASLDHVALQNERDGRAADVRIRD